MLFEPRAVAVEPLNRTLGSELRRKDRFAARGLITMRYFRSLLVPKAGIIALMLWSHKIIRWLTPIWLFTLVCASASLALERHGVFAEGLLCAELGALVLALLSIFLARLGVRSRFLMQIEWFTLMNIGFAFGTIRFIFNREPAFWPNERQETSASNTAIASAMENVA